MQQGLEIDSSQVGEEEVCTLPYVQFFRQIVKVPDSYLIGTVTMSCQHSLLDLLIYGQAY